MTLEELRNKRIGVLGFGVNNQELVKFLVGNGVKLIVRERAAEKQKAFESAYPDLAPHVTWQISPKTLDKLGEFDVVFRSPAIPYLSPKLQAAEKKGLLVYSQTKLFFDLCPSPIIGVTGTKGKGTTSTLIHRVLEAGYTKGNVYLAGNIGIDPFEFFHKLTSDDIVILELSSFQIEDIQKSPHIAVILTVGVDHLDHHATVQEYREAKKRLLAYQGLNDVAIINSFTDMRDFIRAAGGKVYTYSRFAPRRESVWTHREGKTETVFIQLGGSVDSFDLSPRLLKGDHNLDNILPAVIVGTLYDIPARVIAEAVNGFEGLPHRLKSAGIFDGVAFYDDSFATNTASSIAAMDAFPNNRIHLIAGGNDKGESYKAFAEYAVMHCATISLIPGTATKRLQPELKKALSKHKTGCLLLEGAREPWMPTILSGIAPHLSEGDVVLMSPAATGFGAFANYKERGDKFVQAVKERYDRGDS